MWWHNLIYGVAKAILLKAPRHAMLNKFEHTIVLAGLIYCSIISSSFSEIKINDYMPVVKNMSNETINCKMPFCTGPEFSAARINNLLFYLEVDQLPPDSIHGALHDIDYGVEAIDYKVIRHDAHCICLCLYGEGSGASYNSSYKYYNFDAATGRYILISACPKSPRF